MSTGQLLIALVTQLVCSFLYGFAVGFVRELRAKPDRDRTGRQ
ncbi:hypothetical protein [Catenulispora pinistramenti]|nr:hypothetical protein [Catenulispora pinistramenti]